MFPKALLWLFRTGMNTLFSSGDQCLQTLLSFACSGLCFSINIAFIRRTGCQCSPYEKHSFHSADWLSVFLPTKNIAFFGGLVVSVSPYEKHCFHSADWLSVFQTLLFSTVFLQNIVFIRLFRTGNQLHSAVQDCRTGGLLRKHCFVRRGVATLVNKLYCVRRKSETCVDLAVFTVHLLFALPYCITPSPLWVIHLQMPVHFQLWWSNNTVTLPSPYTWMLFCSRSRSVGQVHGVPGASLGAWLDRSGLGNLLAPGGSSGGDNTNTTPRKNNEEEATRTLKKRQLWYVCSDK